MKVGEHQPIDLRLDLSHEAARRIISDGYFSCRRVMLRPTDDAIANEGINILHRTLHESATVARENEKDIIYPMLFMLNRVTLFNDDEVVTQWRRKLLGDTFESISYSVSLHRDLMSWLFAGMFSIVSDDGRPMVFRSAQAPRSGEPVSFCIRTLHAAEIPLTKFPTCFIFKPYHNSRDEFISRCRMRIRRILSFPKQRKKYFAQLLLDAYFYTLAATDWNTYGHLAILPAGPLDLMQSLTILGLRQTGLQPTKYDSIRILSIEQLAVDVPTQVQQQMYEDLQSWCSLFKDPPPIVAR